MRSPTLPLFSPRGSAALLVSPCTRPARSCFGLALIYPPRQALLFIRTTVTLVCIWGTTRERSAHGMWREEVLLFFCRREQAPPSTWWYWRYFLTACILALARSAVDPRWPRCWKLRRGPRMAKMWRSPMLPTPQQRVPPINPRCWARLCRCVCVSSGGVACVC